MERRKFIKNTLLGITSLVCNPLITSCATSPLIEPISIKSEESKSTIPVSITLDYYNSLIISYHSLCTNTEISKKYNSSLFEYFNDSLPNAEKQEYVAHLVDKKWPSRYFDAYKKELFDPKSDNLEQMLFNSKKKFSKSVNNNIVEFNVKFKDYWESEMKISEELVEPRLELINQYLEQIFSLAEEIMDYSSERPNAVDIRILLGLAPSSFNLDDPLKNRYIVTQNRNFSSTSNDDFLTSVVHEVVPHQLAKPYRQLHNEILGKFNYQVEETFVKMLTQNIVEDILGKRVNDSINKSLNPYFVVFNQNWNNLKNQDFHSWYENCLIEIKNKK